MTTIQEFEAKKQEIINTIEILSGKDTDMAIQYAQHQIELLQLPKPTCSTCKHWGVTGTFSSGAAEWGCNNTIVYSKMYDCSSINSDFGCIHHSDYEVNNE